MGIKKKMDSSTLMKRQFVKLHERVQNKYNEMQRKLEKSKSIDMLTTLNEEYDYKDQRKYVSVNDLSRIDEEILITTENCNKKYSGAIVNTEKLRNDVVLQDISYNEAVITECESLISLYEKSESENDDKSIENQFFGNGYLNTSLESLNVKTDDDISPPNTPPRVIRKKRISWLVAAREKRKERDKAQPKERKKDEKKESFDRVVFSNTTKQDTLKIFKRTKIATVTVALIEATGLDETSEEKPRIMNCRLRLGSEKRKSKLVKSSENIIKWQEIHHFNLFDDDSILEILLNDRDAFLGRATLDLSDLEKEKTHKLRIKLEGEHKNIKLFMLLTISGTALINTVYEIDEAVSIQQAVAIKNKYAWYRLWGQFSNVGYLTVTVYGAKGLSGNDCYCVLNINNERIQTPADYKTNSPNWMKIFTFTLSDVTSILEVIVCDERKCEEVGKIYIPLLKIKKGKKWFALKDSSQKERAKGNNPRILLEMAVTWNLVKAAVRVINSKEVNYLQTEEKLDRHVFAKNLTRVKAILTWIMNAFQVFKSAFEWESRKWNLIALIIWQLFCWFFKTWMLPLLLLIPFVWYRPEQYYLFNWANRYIQNISIVSTGEEGKEEKNLSLRQKITNFQDILQTVQNVLGNVASLGERIKNLFNFSEPFISFLAIFFVSAIAFVIYLIPLKYILMGWGVHKFTRKILRPNRIPNNEVLDLLSRVPDDVTLANCETLPLEYQSDEDEYQ